MAAKSVWVVSEEAGPRSREASLELGGRGREEARGGATADRRWVVVNGRYDGSWGSLWRRRGIATLGVKGKE